jgi:hypothetical protein
VTAAVLIAAVAAVLTPGRVVFVDTVQCAVLRVAELPGEGLAIFAAPDGRAVVPLREEDATAIVGPTGRVEAWPGRVFPLFFADWDRMYAVLPGMLATLSYPDRLLLERVPLEGVSGARRAACSHDGRFVAIIPATPGVRALVLVVGLGATVVQPVSLAGEAAHVVVAPTGAFAVVASGSTLETAVMGEPASRAGVDVGGEVLSLCLLPNGRDVIAGLATGTAGELVSVRVDPKARHTLKERFRTRVAGPVVAVSAAGDEVAALSGDSLVILTGGGRRIGKQVPLPGGRDLAVLPENAKSTVPAWGDAAKP